MTVTDFALSLHRNTLSSMIVYSEDFGTVVDNAL